MHVKSSWIFISFKIFRTKWIFKYAISSTAPLAKQGTMRIFSPTELWPQKSLTERIFKTVRCKTLLVHPKNVGKTDMKLLQNSKSLVTSTVRWRQQHNRYVSIWRSILSQLSPLLDYFVNAQPTEQLTLNKKLNRTACEACHATGDACHTHVKKNIKNKNKYCVRMVPFWVIFITIQHLHSFSLTMAPLLSLLFVIVFLVPRPADHMTGKHAMYWAACIWCHTIMCTLAGWNSTWIIKILLIRAKLAT